MQKKRLAPQKCYMFTQREWRGMPQISLIQMHDFGETLPLRVQNSQCKTAKVTSTPGIGVFSFKDIE